MKRMSYAGIAVFALSVAGCGAAPTEEGAAGSDVAVASEAVEGGHLETGYPSVGYTGCSAVLISPTIALSATHCRWENGITVNLGNDYRLGWVSSHQVDATISKYDYMMMHLTAPVTGVPFFQVNNGAYPAVGSSCTAVGFGKHTEPNGSHTSGVKYSANVTVSAHVNVGGANPLIRTVWGDGLAVHGDSGSPLICDNKIAGIASTIPGGPVGPGQNHNSYAATDAAWVAANMGLAPPAWQNSLYATTNGALRRIDDAIGNFQKISSSAADWSGTSSITSLNGSLYAIQNGYLTGIDPQTGTPTLIGGQDWSGQTTLTALNGALYVTQDFGLWKIDSLSTGAYHRVGQTDWTGATSMTARAGWLYIIQDSKLYKVNPSTGTPTQLGGSDWAGPTSMAVVGSSLYILQDFGLWTITNFSTGAYTRVGTTDWTGAEALTSINGLLYLVQNLVLHRVNPTTGSYETLGVGDWPSPVFMAPLP